MNLASFIILAIILLLTAWTIFKTIRSKGACDDCSVNTCPVKSATPVLPTENTPEQSLTKVKNNCCD